jgi:hypothetical protein
MNLLNKSFKDNITGETVVVNDIDGGIVTLNNGEKVISSRILDSNYYEEVVDPIAFFKNESNILMDSIMERVKTIKTDNLIDDNTISNSINSMNNGFSPTTNESAIIEISEEEERAELLRKYNITQQPKTTSVEELLGESINSTQPVVNQPVVTQQVISQPVLSQPVVTQPVVTEDPILFIFKNSKRKLDFKMDFSIEEKIPRIDFIEMMEDSYNTSIIDYLADEFTNKLLNDPSVIKNLIKEKIESLVKNKSIEEKVETKPRNTRSKTKVEDEQVETKKTNTRSKTKVVDEQVVEKPKQRGRKKIDTNKTVE